MKKFYNNISSNGCVYLLKATPYTKENRIKFDNNLTKEDFFGFLYTERSTKAEHKAENDLFDNKINAAKEDLQNEFSKVSMIHISGYGGCGKTTFIHHLLWTLKDSIGVYDVIDYEGCTKAAEPFIKRIARLIYKIKNTSSLLNYFESIVNNTLFNTYRFSKQIPVLYDFSNELSVIIDGNNYTENSLGAFLIHFEKNYISEDYKPIVGKDFVSFLLFLEFILLLFDKFENNNESAMILIIDNADSLSDLSEEHLLLKSIREFENNCNYFFGWNLENDGVYNDKKVSDVLRRTKLTMFFTTRVATIKKYEIIEPDWERIDGWMSIRFPEHYYDHKDIINHRIEYYLSLESPKSNIAEELSLISKLVEIAYHNYNFMRLFNGSYRTCVERICDILRTIHRSQIKEMIKLYSERTDNRDAIEGAIGYYLYMILCVLKNEKTYTETLDLSPCRKDGTISLSRIILTILREKGDRCSLYDLFTLLVPVGYKPKMICTQIWNLCEVARNNAWRRLLLFDLITPSSLDELKQQADKFINGDEEINHYTELIICTAGQAYMEFVVPHFEFMLSRHELGVGTSVQSKYQPLFSSSSEELIRDENGEMIYRFEKKISWVFKDVEDCCYNSVKFAERVEKEFNLSKDEYINNTFFNYHSVGWDNNVGPKQSYESRLIFRHIGYIEKYRNYLLNKKKDISLEERIAINKKLVEWIIKYIDLYYSGEICYRTEYQDIAAKDLLDLSNKIIKSNYKDFVTRIERSNE